MENTEKPSEAPQEEKKGSRNFVLPLILAAAIALGGLGYVAVSQQNKAKNAEQAQNANPSVAPGASTTSGSVILYGAWGGNKSMIKGYDLEQKQGYLLAELGQNIKRVSPAKPDGLYFIKDVDANDHGTEVAKYNIPQKEAATFIKADLGFGIDDYMVSPNGSFIVTWEVMLPPGSKALYNGASRVYSVNTSNPSVKQLLYDEVANKPIHYPRGVTNEGKVFTDMFLPNSGFGWAYGMSVSDASGQSKQDITDMTNGTYGRQPRMSPDGTQFVFVGYDGSRGPGTETVNGKKRAIAVPNSVEVLSAQTLKRTKLNVPSGIYDDARFDASGKHIFITKVLDENDWRKTSVLVYDLTAGSAKEVPDSLGKRGVSVLPNGDALMALLNVSPQSLGNLGETYSFVTNSYEIDSLSGGQGTPVAASDTNIQYIGMVSATDFSSGVFTEANKEKAKESMQMDTFQLKADLLKDRLKLESDAAVAAAAAAAASASAQPSGAQGGGQNGGGQNGGNGEGSSAEQESQAQN